MNNIVDDFRNAMLENGLIAPQHIISDGNIHRFSSNGKAGDDAGWYVLFVEPAPAGAFGDWRSGAKYDWRQKNGHDLSPTERISYQAQINHIKQVREAEETLRKKEARNKALSRWENSHSSDGQHPYLIRKNIKPYGVRVYKNVLIIPLRDKNAELHSLQFISEHGKKRFLTGGKVSGCYFSIGSINHLNVICIAEGFATSATIHEATLFPIAVAFSKSNLLAVAKILRKKFPKISIIVCADDDYETESNPGITEAMNAAKSVDGLVAIPKFDNDRPSGKKDFNDIAEIYGLNRVKEIIHDALSQNSGSDSPKAHDDWPDPIPLALKSAETPYPIEALPEILKNAIIEVQGFTKAPISLVASSALGALSLAGQTYIDIQRDEKLSGPTSLFLLTIADSGERKTTCDNFFTQVIHDYEKIQREKAKPEIKKYNAALGNWQAKIEGVKTKIRRYVGDENHQDELNKFDKMLLELENDKPIPPRIPRLIYSDVTPEALKTNLATKWPSAGIISSEGGVVFGAHAMNKDSAMRNFATYNQGWDGKGIPTDRNTTESHNIQKVRLTMAIQIQEETLKDFVSKLGPLARGIGYFARVLLAWPESTQGSRFYTKPPTSWPALARFNQQLSKILNRPAPVDNDGNLYPEIMKLAGLAKLAWKDFHDRIEKELNQGGEFYAVRDVASKAADNAARLSGLFHIMEHEFTDEINEDTFDRASVVVEWHLKESQRIFSELALPKDTINAHELDRYLIKYAQKNKINRIPCSMLLQYGPSSVRKKTDLEHAMTMLIELNRIRVNKDCRSKFIEINPALLIANDAKSANQKD